MARKKRVIELNKFDFAFKTAVVLSSEAAKVQRSQIKVLQQMEEHKNTMVMLNKHGDSRVKTLMTTYMKTKDEMRLHSPSETEKGFLLQKTDVFQVDGSVDGEGFHFGHTWSAYMDYIEEEEARAKADALIRNAAKGSGHPFLRMPDLSKCGMKTCSGCGEKMTTCHDVAFGAYCFFRVLRFCHVFPDFVDEVTIKKNLH